jgi:hypothetical protein
VSRASSTLEGSLPCKDTDPSHPTTMEVAEGPSALELAAAEDPAPEGGAGSFPAPEGVVGSNPAPEGSVGGNPAPEGVQACSLSTASMDVHIGLPPIWSEEVTVTRDSMALTGQVALEVSEPDARSLLPAGGAEVTPSRALKIVPADLPSSNHAPALTALGLPLFLSNLQVSQPFALYCSYWRIIFFCLSVYDHKILLMVYSPN